MFSSGTPSHQRPTLRPLWPVVSFSGDHIGRIIWVESDCFCVDTSSGEVCLPRHAVYLVQHEQVQLECEASRLHHYAAPVPRERARRPAPPRRRGKGKTTPQLARLTDRELDVLTLVAQGLSNSEVAERIGVKPRAVANHVSRILEKLGAENRGKAVQHWQAQDVSTSQPRPCHLRSLAPASPRTDRKRGPLPAVQWAEALHRGTRLEEKHQQNDDEYDYENAGADIHSISPYI
jgi:DNA-binding CsgD family transcriptional regulator